VRVVDLRSRLRAPATSRYRIAQEGVNAILEFEGKRYILPGQVASTLRALSECPMFRTGELPGTVDADAKLGLSRYLYEIGFLTAAQ